MMHDYEFVQFFSQRVREWFDGFTNVSKCPELTMKQRCLGLYIIVDFVSLQ